MKPAWFKAVNLMSCFRHFQVSLPQEVILDHWVVGKTSAFRSSATTLLNVLILTWQWTSEPWIHRTIWCSCQPVGGCTCLTAGLDR